MNRLNQLADQKAVLPDLTSSFLVEQSRMESTADGQDSLGFFVPLHYESNYAYPLLVWLHGPGDNEAQLKRIMPLVSMRNYVAVAPRGTFPEQDGCDRREKFCWRQDPHSIMLAEQRLNCCIDAACQRFHVDPKKIFLAGYECGGTMAFRLAMSLPDLVAGVVSVGGPFPQNHFPLRAIGKARRVPLLIAHGRDSQKYPVDQVCADLRLFHSAGMKVTLRQYPCGDDITTTMLTDLDAWVMEQVTGVPSSSTGSPCYRTGELN